MSSNAKQDLDPTDWPETRAQAHRMLDDMLDHIAGLADGPVWRPMPDAVRGSFRQDLPADPAPLAEVHAEFLERILPFGPGNAHSGFMGWVHGGGTVAGMLAEMLAGGLNANLGGRDHAPIEVERQILHWLRPLFGYPEGASGLFVTGSSMANFLALLVARTQALGAGIRAAGLVDGGGGGLVAYTSKAAHGCIRQAMEMAGLGGDQLRRIATDALGRMDLDALGQAVAADRAAGLRPFLLVGTAGSVDIGAIDDLTALADLARTEQMWFHVDGAFGALAMLSPGLAPLLAGIERSDSLALDFHKWGQVPYDAGYVLVRDGAAHRATFAQPAAYLRRETRGLAAGTDWPCDYGPDLSRGFRALKTWFTVKVYGAERLGAVIARTCDLAQYLRRRVEAEPQLELLAPVGLNIVCFRHRGPDADGLNAAIVADLHESGLAAPSSTIIDGKFAIRAALVNHRIKEADLDRLVAATLAFGAQRLN